MSRGNFIQTITGRKFYPCSPNPDDVNIIDIAYSLSTRIRYNGHVRDFLHYSIAEHSILLAENIVEYALKFPCDCEGLEYQHGWLLDYEYHCLMLQLWALLHDASEAYIPDVPRPIKPTLTNFKKIENRIMLAIAKHYNLMPLHQPHIVHKIDTAILADEKKQVMRHQIPWNDIDLTEDPLNIEIQFLSPEESFEKFADMYLDITKQMENIRIKKGYIHE